MSMDNKNTNKGAEMENMKLTRFSINSMTLTFTDGVAVNSLDVEDGRKALGMVLVAEKTEDFTFVDYSENILTGADAIKKIEREYKETDAVNFRV